MKTQNGRAKRITVYSLGINIGLTGLKIFSGIFGRSGAMVADGIHSLSDLLTDLAVIIGLRLGEQPADDCHNYGHEKYETLVTAIISIFLFIAGYEVLKSGSQQIILVLQGNSLQQPHLIALYAAVISIVVKEIMYRITVHIGNLTDSPSLVANAWHHRSDALSSVGTLCGVGGAIFLGERWTFLDPLASIVVSIFIFKVAYQILLPCIGELTESSLSLDDKEKITEILQLHSEVKGFHKVRTRKIGSKVIIDMHVLVEDNIDLVSAHNIATELEAQFKEAFDPSCLITIHIEPYANNLIK